MIKYKNIPVFVAHKGCPNDCVFCNQKKISGAKDEVDEKSLRKLLSSSVIDIIPQNTQIAFFGGSFTGIERNTMEKYLSIAQEYVDKYNLNGIRLSTRPDYIDTEILNILKKYSVKTIELGVQSMDNEVLKLNERNMTVDKIQNSCALILNYGFELGVQLMTSMYGSDSKKDIKSAIEVVKLKPHFVRIYPTVVIPETKLYDLYIKGVYETKTLQETIEISADMLEIFTKNNIEVIRIGLMTNEDINCDNVIGAYHPAFGELVWGRVYYKEIEKLIGNSETRNNELVIHSPENKVSQISGHKRENLIKLKENYEFSNIKFNYIDDAEIKVEIIARV